MSKFVALPIAAVCAATALYFSFAPAKDQPAGQTPKLAAAQVEAAQVEAAQVEAAALAPVVAPPATSPAASNCKDKLTVKLSTSEDPKDAGRLIIGKWRTSARKLHGAAFADFKVAGEPNVHCTKQGKQATLSCFAEARPCAK